MIIRDERPEDVDAIRNLTARAFAGMPYSDGTESAIVDRLREAGTLDRVIRVRADYTRMDALLGYLTEICCAGAANCDPASPCTPKKKATRR